jgi:hypothetical protein
VAGADGGKGYAAGPVYVDDASSGEIPLEGACRLLFDVRPRAIGDRSQLAMKIIHAGSLL